MSRMNIDVAMCHRLDLLSTFFRYALHMSRRDVVEQPYCAENPQPLDQKDKMELCVVDQLSFI